MKKILKLLVILFLAFVLIIGIAFFTQVSKLGKQVDNLSFPEIDMSKVEDGTFIGAVETNMVKATVELTVKDHVIEDIVITRHENGKGTPAEVIVDDMVMNNTYEVDGISGATTSSKVIKSAVATALLQGME